MSAVLDLDGGPRPLRGSIRLPGDKSISHRALLFAGLAEGRSRITGLGTGGDVAATAAALRALGVAVARQDGAVIVDSPGLAAWSEPDDVVDCGNSGTTIRVLTGALAGRPFCTVLTGDASLRRRPMARVADPLRAMGARIDGRDGGSRAPLVVRGGALTGRRHELTVASAQVKSAILLAGLQAEGPTEVHEPLRSRDHTERMLRALGVPVEVDGTVVRIGAGVPEPCSIAVPGDPSSAAFFAVAAAITPGSEFVCPGLAGNPTRIGFVAVLRRMGADIDFVPTGEVCGEPVGELRVRGSALRATVIEGAEIPAVIDEIPALAVAAAFADGVTEIRDAAELRVKESDRITTVATLIGAIGVECETRPDGLRITGGQPHAAAHASGGDHRIAMAAAVASIAVPGRSRIAGWDAVVSSFPEFADRLADLAGGLS